MSAQPFSHNLEHLKQLFSCIDLTSLNTTDGEMHIRQICQKLNEFPAFFPGFPQVAAICVYPSFIHVVRGHLNAVGIECVAVSAGFPSSQTFPAVKELESRMAIEAGADEIDVVLSLGRFLEGDQDFVREEIRRIKAIITPRPLKVILETGLLPDEGHIYRAAMISMQAGADFIKTSTGKIQPAATLEAVRIMCRAIRDYSREEGRRVGIKPAGGISTAAQALAYANLISEELGIEWLDQRFFRIGASRLANQLLADMKNLQGGEPPFTQYF